MKIAVSLMALAWAVTAPAHAAQTWQSMAPAPRPAAGFDAGDPGKVVITCDDNRGLHTYVLAISGPAGSFKDGDWTSVRVAGKPVSMTVEVKNGIATLTAASSTTRYASTEAPGDVEVYDAVAAMTRASSIAIASGDFHLTIPATGLDSALAEATSTCGDPQKLSKQVKARSQP